VIEIKKVDCMFILYPIVLRYANAESLPKYSGRKGQVLRPIGTFRSRMRVDQGYVSHPNA
jgi:hypothetical protein